MPPFKVSDRELMQALLAVFRKEGYEGSSMSMLSRATGLKRSSLYHRFPGGKQQMAQEVLAFTGDWMEAHITSSFQAGGNPLSRLRKVLEHISDLYAGGKKSCILRALVMGGSAEPFLEGIHMRFENWIGAFAAFGRSIGLPDHEADKKAQQAVIQIQGALVLAQAMDNPNIFQESLQQIEEMYKYHVS